MPDRNADSILRCLDENSNGVTYIVDADAIENELALDELPQRLAKESA